jgi:hypothetical protein
VSEYFDEQAQFADAWKADRERLKVESEACHSRIDRAARMVAVPAPYASALDAEGDPAPAALDSTARLDSMIGFLLSALSDAHALSLRLVDPRARRLGDALAALPGDGS